MAREETKSGYLPGAILRNEDTSVEEHVFIRTTIFPNKSEDWLFFSHPVDEEFERLYQAGEAYLYGAKLFPQWGSSFIAWLRLPSVEDIVSAVLDMEQAPGVFFTGFMTYRPYGVCGQIDISVLRALLRDYAERSLPKAWIIHRNQVDDYKAVRDFAFSIQEGHFQSAVPALYQALKKRQADALAASIT